MVVAGLIRRFCTLGAERGLAALNVLANSLIVARLLDPTSAATYFFVASIAQMIMSPWIPTGEYAWLGRKSVDSAGGEGDDVRNIYILVLVSTLLAGVITFATGATFVAIKHGELYIVLSAVVSNILYVNLIRLLQSKYGAVRRFMVITTCANSFGLALKALAIFATVREFAPFALFSEVFLGGLLAATFSGVRGLDFSAKNLVAIFRAFHFSEFVGPLLSVFAVLIGSRMLLLCAGVALDAPVYARLGLALQVLNSATFMSTALQGALANAIRQAKALDYRGLLKIVGGAMAIGGVISAVIAGVLVVEGRQVLTLLLGKRVGDVAGLVLMGFPFFVALTVQATSVAVSACFKCGKIFSVLSICGAVISTGVFFIFEGDVTSATLAWALTHFASTCCVALVILSFVRTKWTKVAVGVAA